MLLLLIIGALCTVDACTVSDTTCREKALEARNAKCDLDAPAACECKENYIPTSTSLSEQNITCAKKCRILEELEDSDECRIAERRNNFLLAIFWGCFFFGFFIGFGWCVKENGIERALCCACISVCVLLGGKVGITTCRGEPDDEPLNGIWILSLISWIGLVGILGLVEIINISSVSGNILGYLIVWVSVNAVLLAVVKSSWCNVAGKFNKDSYFSWTKKSAKYAAAPPAPTAPDTLVMSREFRFKV